MPVTVYSHGANKVTDFRYRDEYTVTPLTVMRNTSFEEYEGCKSILQSSFDGRDLKPIHGRSNGFVTAAVEAYSSHHHLVIRPDDVWISILTQFSFYVNAHAEELRSTFVSHDGKKKLVVNRLGDRHSVDFGGVATELTELMEEHINDASLRGWIMQDFSTTTDNDRIVKAIAMMGTLQKYFEFGCCITCGLPSVTLLGKREDWAKMLAALDRLPTFGKETAEWAGVLSVVLSRFVATFDEPESERTQDFWQRIAHYSAGGSGPSYWSGWITAFCFWDAEGKALRDKGRFPKNYGMNEAITLTLDEQLFHWVDSDEMPPGYVTVPVTVNDNGAVFVGRMVAGVVGVSVVSSGRELEHGGTGMDTLRPEVGWWMFEDKEAEPEWTPVPELHGT